MICIAISSSLYNIQIIHIYKKSLIIAMYEINILFFISRFVYSLRISDKFWISKITFFFNSLNIHVHSFFSILSHSIFLDWRSIPCFIPTFLILIISLYLLFSSFLFCLYSSWGVAFTIHSNYYSLSASSSLFQPFFNSYQNYLSSLIQETGIQVSHTIFDILTSPIKRVFLLLFYIIH